MRKRTETRRLRPKLLLIIECKKGKIRVCFHVARSEDGVGVSVQQQALELGIFVRVVFGSAFCTMQKAPRACSIAVRTAAPLP